MPKTKRIAAAWGFAACLLLGAAAGAQAPQAPQTPQARFSGDVIRIGFITDLSGLYADIDGPGGVEAIRMAIADAGEAVEGAKVELLFADHQNRADVAATRAREWFEQQDLDLLIGGTNSGASLAMARVAQEKRKPFIAVGAASAQLTNERCSPYTLHWAYDTVALARGTGGAVVKNGGRTWFFLTADYAFGASLQEETARVVREAGGKVLGSATHPLSAADFSPFLRQARSSGAQILGLANAGGDTISSIQAAHESGLTRTMRLAGLLMFINDIHSLGLPATQGMYLTDSWYWDLDERTRAWAGRFRERVGRMPSSLQAGNYSAALQYLQAARAAGTDDAGEVLGQLRRTRIDDVFARGGYLRPDGRMVHDMYLMQVKTPAESRGAWDYLKVVEVLRGEQAWTTREESRCALWKR